MSHAYTIICPYCFGIMQDDEVLFRSDKVNLSSGNSGPVRRTSAPNIPRISPDDLLPDGYDNWDDFDAKFPEDQQKDTLIEVRDKVRKLLEQDQPIHTTDLYPDAYDEEEFKLNFPNGPVKVTINKAIEKLQNPAVSQTGPSAAPRKAASGNFFDLVPYDPVYENFWSYYGGTTEVNPADEKQGIAPYTRPLIDPRSKVHQQYLKMQPDGEYFLRDKQRMVKGVELKNWRFPCFQRVCPHCHNPLPPNYGKNEVKFITVVGITASGKTVYLSQLFSSIEQSLSKVALTPLDAGYTVNTFLKDHPLATGAPAFGSTKAENFQQPLFYDLEWKENDGSKRVETLVIYDVSGEVFEPDTQFDLVHFAPFIQHAHGILLLIAPEQFDSVQELNKKAYSLHKPTRVLHAIHDIVTGGDNNAQCNKPVAVCISQIDKLMQLFSDNLRSRLMEDVQPIYDSLKYPVPLFNATQYNPVFRELTDFFKEKNMALANMMRTDFSNYAYFAFTALGTQAEVKKSKETSKEMGTWVFKGPVIPKWVEEPLLWLFHIFGYIGTDVPIQYPDRRVVCPFCQSIETFTLPKNERIERTGFLGLEKREVNCCCKACGNRWYDSSVE